MNLYNKLYILLIFFTIFGCDSDCPTVENKSEFIFVSDENIVKSGLIFHGIPNNYDVDAGIWVDGSGMGNHFNLANPNVKPIKYINGKFTYKNLNNNGNNIKQLCPSGSNYPYICTYEDAKFQLNHSPATANANEMSFAVVIQPINFYEAPISKNSIISINDTNSNNNTNFTVLRIFDNKFIFQQRGDSDTPTLDSRDGQQLVNYIPNKSIQVVTGRILNRTLELYVNGTLINKHQVSGSINFKGKTTYLGGGEYSYEKEVPREFDGLIYEVFLYDRGLNESELLVTNNYLMQKYKLK